MNPILSVIPVLLIEHGGWVLLHSVWQFLGIAVLVFVCLPMLPKSSASIRYRMLLSGLLLITVAPLVTWFVLRESMIAAAAVTPVAEVTSETYAITELSPLPGNGSMMSLPASDRADSEASEVAVISAEAAAPVSMFEAAAACWRDGLVNVLQPWLSTIVVLWCGGVLLFSVRPLLSWWNVRRLRTTGISPVADSIQNAVRRMAERLRVKRRVEILASTVVTSPVVVGCFRSVILVPVSFISSVPWSQLEAVLAHELAHVRRYDYLINLLQTLIETLFFYHPAVWWLSDRIREEREICCDDLVVTTFKNKAAYGRALLAVEEFRSAASASSALVLRARGGSLVSRISRLVGEPSGKELHHGLNGGVLALILLGLVASGVWISNRAGADEIPESGKSAVASEVSNGVSLPDGHIAQLPGGRSVELVGITKNTRPASEGWKPDGRPLNLTADEWPNAPNFEGAVGVLLRRPRNEPNRARDFLFRLSGLRDFPSISISFSTHNVTSTELAFLEPFQLRVTNKAPIFKAANPDELSRSVQVAITDEPWGKWLKINADNGEVLNALGDEDLYRRVYESVEIMGSRNSPDHWPHSAVLEIRHPITHEREYAFEVRGIDSNGKVRPCSETSSSLRRDQSAHIVRYGMSPSSSDRSTVRTLSRFEYRLRPYRHLVTFENIVMDEPTETPSDVKVSVESLSNPNPGPTIERLR